MTILATQALGYQVRDKSILEDLSVTLSPGEFTGLIGPNGAGKTTLLKCLLGLLRPTAGQVQLDGDDIAGLHPRDIAKSMSYLAQGAPCHWPVSVERVVALGLPHSVRRDTDRQDRIDRALAAIGIEHLRHQSVLSLSGGERTMTMLARGLVEETPMLLADEPVTGLDPKHQLEVMALLRRQVGPETGVVAVLHDLGLAARFCTRLIVLKGGRIHADGAPDSVLTPELIHSVYGIQGRLTEVDGEPVVVTKTDVGQ